MGTDTGARKEGIVDHGSRRLRSCIQHAACTYIVLFAVIAIVSCGNQHNEQYENPPGPGIEIRPEGLWKTGPVPGNPDQWLLPIGQRITPLAITGSRLFRFDYAMPLGMQVSPDGAYLFITNTGKGSVALLVVDAQSGEVLSSIQKNGYFLGLAVSPNGREVYVSGGGRGVIETYTFDPESGELSLVPERTMHVRGFIGGITTNQDGSLLLAVTQLPTILLLPRTVELPGELCLFDTATGRLLGRTATGFNPYTVAIHPNGRDAYVSNELSGSVSVLDISDPSSIKTKAVVTVEKNPEALAVSLDGSRLYVTNADEDSVSIIDLETEAPGVLKTIDLRGSGEYEYGSGPNALAFSRTGKRLYVAQGGRNKLAVIDTDSGDHIGDIPTGWYPTAVCLQARQNNGLWEETLYVVNGKGIGTPGKGHMGHVPGAISILPVPADNDLPQLTSLTAENNAMPGRLFSITTDRCEANPIPLHEGCTTPIKHVFLVVRENKSYDYYLGKYQPPNGQADADPDLVVGHYDKILPNLYRLAQRFAIGDNYYSNAEASDQGHEMLTGCMVNTYVEKLAFAERRPVPIEVEMVFSPATWPKKEFVFQNALRNGVSFRDYGQAIGAGKDSLLFNDKWVHLGRNDPPWFWLFTKDVDKIAERIEEWESPRFSGENLPKLIFMLLPDDHTFGDTFLMPTFESMVADNDEATGIFIEWLSHSPYWKESVVFITEDDAQDGSDHVDAHRTPLLVVSPWVREGYVSHVKYSEANIYATIEHILGLPPMTIFDEVAQPMFDLFTFEENDQPFEHTPKIWPDDRNLPGTEAAERCATMNFAEPDEAEGLSEAIQDLKREKEGAQELNRRIRRGAARAWDSLKASAHQDYASDPTEPTGPAGVVRAMVRCARIGDLHCFAGLLDESVQGIVDRCHDRRALLNATVVSQDPVKDVLVIFNKSEPRPLEEAIQGDTAIVKVEYKDGTEAILQFRKEGVQWKFLLSHYLAHVERILNNGCLLSNAFYRGEVGVDR